MAKILSVECSSIWQAACWKSANLHSLWLMSSCVPDLIAVKVSSTAGVAEDAMCALLMSSLAQRTK